MNIKIFAIILFWVLNPSVIFCQFSVYKQCDSIFCKQDDSNLSSHGILDEDGKLVNSRWYKIIIDDTIVLSENIFIIPTAQIDSVIFYTTEKQDNPKYFGSKVHQSNKGFWDRQILFPLSEIDPYSRTFYINVKNKSDYSVALKILNNTTFKKEETLKLLFFGIYTGTIFIFILFQTLVLRRFPVFNFNFFYLLYLISTYLYFFTEFGLSALYLWQNRPDLDEIFTFIFILNSSLFLLLFIFDFFKQSLPYIIKITVKTFTILITLLLVSVITQIFEKPSLYPIVFYGILLTVIVCYLSALSISVIGIINRDKNAVTIFISFLLLVFGAFLKPLLVAGIIDNNMITENSAIFGHFCEVIIISSVMINLGVQQIKQSQILKLENTMLEQNLLTSQISPHFVFNSLNSVQFFLMNNEKEKAVNFISEYAKLIRLALNSAHHQKITLANEILFLSTYLKLEKIKSANAFTFDIINEVNDEVVEQINISPLLLQPFVENAIIHGIKNRNDKLAKVIVHFSYHNEMLIVRITDNGKGIDLSVKKKDNKDSLGTFLTNKRIQIFNQKKENNLIYSVPYPTEEIFKGTQVSIEIKPLQ
jgi:sensor histidine kinase YesM